jgi:hypothetical protein
LWLLLLLAISGLVQIANQTLITTEILADEFSRYFDDEMMKVAGNFDRL